MHHTVTGNKVYYTNIYAGDNHTIYLSHWTYQIFVGTRIEQTKIPKEKMHQL
jgi:hypothetical protein